MSENTVTCLACAHVAALGTGPAPADSILVCGECGARMPFGTLAPRVVVEPFADANGRKWVRYRFQDPSTKRDLYVTDLDPEHAAKLAKGTLVLVIP